MKKTRGDESPTNNRKKQKLEDFPASILEAIQIKSCVADIVKMIDHGVNLEERENSGKTCLMISLINKDFTLIRALLSAGADITAVDADFTTVLMLTVEHTPDCDFIEDLLKQGIDVSVQNKSGDSALLVACRRGNLDVVQLLLRYGANVSVQNKDGQTPLMAATQAGSVEIMKILVSARAEINLTDVVTKETALFKVQNEESFFLLLQSGANPNATNKFEESVLLSLVSNKPHLLTCIKHLLESGADPSVKDYNGSTPLIEACNHPSCEQIDLVKLLLQQDGINPSHKNKSEMTALFYAIHWGHIEIAKLLISAGALPNAKSVNSSTSLMQLCRYKTEHLDMFNLFVEAGASVSDHDISDKCESVLMLAVKYGHFNYIKLLIKFGAHVNARNRKGDTVLHYVCDLEKENIELLNILIVAGVNTSAQNDEGKTALMLAVKHNHFQIIDILVHNGANVCAQDKDGKNVLMKAIENLSWRSAKLVELFLKNGANLSARDKNGNTALMLATTSSHCLVSKNLIDAGVDISAVNNYGNTALMLACENENFYIAHSIIKAGGAHQILMKNRDGDTCLDFAVSRRSSDILFLLLKSCSPTLNKTKSIISIIINGRYISDKKFVRALKKILNYNSHVHCSVIVYDLVKIMVNNVQNYYYYYSEKFEAEVFTEIIKLYVEEASKLKSSRILTPHVLSIHELVMVTSKHSDFDSNDNNFFKHVFDTIMKSPFKIINWTCSTTVSNSFFLYYSTGYDMIETDDVIMCETVGRFIVSHIRKNYFSTSDIKMFRESLKNMLDNGFSGNSSNPKIISPLSLLMCLWISHNDNDVYLICKDLISRGVKMCQRLLFRFLHQPLLLLSEQLQLPDAIWLAFQQKNKLVLDYLLPYWSAPPLALLAFVPPVSLIKNEHPLHKIQIGESLYYTISAVYPTLVKIGGPLPPGHDLIQSIQNYLESLTELHGETATLLEQFKKLHSETPPSLKQLCRHVIRGCLQTGDDLPQRLSSLIVSSPELCDFLTLKNTAPD